MQTTSYCPCMRWSEAQLSLPPLQEMAARGWPIDRVCSFGVLRAEKRGRPRWPGFLTGGVNPLRARSQADAQWRTKDQERRPRDQAQRSRLQWRDRVGIAPTSRNRRGHLVVSGFSLEKTS